MTDQKTLFHEPPKAKVLAAPPSKASFTPPTLENGLDPQKVQDHAMLWLRSGAKKHKNSAKDFLLQQLCEVRFKQTEYDQKSLVRQSILGS